MLLRDLLAFKRTVDLDPREFGAGRCARTGLATATVLHAVTDNAASYTVIVARSFADYLGLWLARAAQPHGVYI